MIVVLDTNALHGDVYAARPGAQTFLAAAGPDTYEVWVPSVVIEELVRQFPERFQAISKLFRKHRYETSSLGLKLPELAAEEEAIAAYRGRLEAAVTREGVRIVEPPKRAGKIAEWVAQRREPIPNDGRGAVDTQVWLTAIEAAEEDNSVVLVARNPRDFADPEDETALHPTLKSDLAAFELDEEAIVISQTIRDFLQDHVEADQAAIGRARALLSNAERRAALTRAIEDAIEWFPLEADSPEWSAAFDQVEVLEAHLLAFDVEALALVRADAGENSSYFTLEAYGSATLDVSLFTYEAATLPENSPISPEGFEPETPMSRGEAVFEAALVVDVILDHQDPGVAIEEATPLDNSDAFTLFETWAEAEPQACLDLVSAAFDVGGTQVALAARPIGVEKFYFRDGALIARVDFNIDYRNPIDAEDETMGAENDTNDTFDVIAFDPNLESGMLSRAEVIENVFPD